MTVELVTTSSPEIVEAMERLIPQLSRSAPALTAEQCEALIAQEGVFLFVFRPEAEAGQSAPILGMLTLATFTIPTGLRAWVEDVVVDGEARGQGAGQALVEAAVEHAGKLGARTVDLTSRPSREPPTASTAAPASSCGRPTSTATPRPEQRSPAGPRRPPPHRGWQHRRWQQPPPSLRPNLQKRPGAASFLKIRSMCGRAEPVGAQAGGREVPVK